MDPTTKQATAYRRYLTKINVDRKRMPVKAHSKDKPTNVEAAKERRSILKDRQSGRDLTSRIDSTDCFVTIRVPITTPTGKDSNHRRVNGTQLIDFSGPALSAGGLFSVVKVRRRTNTIDNYNTSRRLKKSRREKFKGQSDEVHRNRSRLRLLKTNERRKFVRG